MSDPMKRNTLRQRLQAAFCDHDFGPWRHGYPTRDSVAQYSHCQRCGITRRNWIQRPGEQVSMDVKREREKTKQ